MEEDDVFHDVCVKFNGGFNRGKPAHVEFRSRSEKIILAQMKRPDIRR